jgi:cerevisin
MKGLLSLSIIPLLAYASPLVVDSIHNDAAPILSSTNSKEVPDSYIIVFKKHVTDNAAAAHHSWVQDIHLKNQNTRTELRKRDQFPFSDTIFGGLKHTYNIAGGLLGYAGHFDDETIEQVRRHPDVSTVRMPSKVA